MDNFSQFLDTYFWFLAQATLLSIGVIGVKTLCQYILCIEKLDRNGAARELGEVRSRIGMEDEQPMDNLACAITHAAWVVFIGLVLLSFYIAHSTVAGPDV